MRPRAPMARPIWAALALGLVLMAPLAQAQAQRAHVHGVVALDIAIEGPTVSIALSSPLDSLLGFERAPRTDAEKASVEQLVAQLRAADALFTIDPAANCKLGPVALQSTALGLGKAEPGAKADAHADLDATFHFNCTNAPAARYIDTALFTTFKGMRQVNAQIVSPAGQYQRSLKRPNLRLAWGR